MSITPYMIEAGVAAMARMKAQPCEDSAVVSVVFNAMTHAAAYEKKKRDGTAVREVYVHKSWPAWRFGPDGAEKLCQSEADVPEGWTDKPEDGIAAEVVAEVIGKRRGRPPKVQPSV